MANVLRFGTAALVLALVACNGRPAAGVTLVSPIRAMQHFALDPGWQASVATEPRRRMSAVDIQRHYLDSVEARFESLGLPDWAEQVCRMWRGVLDDLAENPARLDATLDWAIKRRLFERHLARRGIPWSSLRWWNLALDRLTRAWAGAGSREPFALRFVVESHPHVVAERPRVARLLAARGLDWEGFEALAAARLEVFEFDAKFGALGEAGLYNALEAAGALEHRMALDVERAMTEPPPDTRAKIRGNVVRRLSNARIPYGAEWTAVYDNSARLALDLQDPFETEERWSAWPFSGDSHTLPGHART